MRRLFIHVHHSGDDIVLTNAILQKLKRPSEIFFHFGFVGLCKLRADRYQRVHELHAVLPHPAASHLDAVLDLLLVTPLWRHQMEILRGAAGINIRVAGVDLLCPLVVGTQRLGRAALVFCKS